MIQVNVREARQKLAELLSAAEAGETVEVTRRGRTVARIMPPAPTKGARLPDLAEFRASQGRPRRHAKATIAALRDAERY